MDVEETDQVVTRAVALALMRQVRELLEALPASDATAHLERAIDAVRQRPGVRVGSGQAD